MPEPLSPAAIADRRADLVAGMSYGWRWQQFGGKLMLVTDGGGARVVLSGRPRERGHFDLLTRNDRGTMETLTPDHPLGKLLAAVPDLVEVVRRVAEREGWQDAADTLRKAGLE